MSEVNIIFTFENQSIFMKAFKDDKQWVDGIYGELEEQFQSENFFFSLGFMLFTAKK